MQRGTAGALRRGLLFVVSAPSGAGKTSLVGTLVKADPSLAVSVSHTTRPKRVGEIDGVHYHFVDAPAFAALRDAGGFLEWASVYGHAYGTERRGVVDAVATGRDVILEIDWQGAAQIRRGWPQAVCIFVLPPSRAALRERLAGRGQDEADVIARRTAAAMADLSHYREFDHLVVNDDFDAAIESLQRIIGAARRGERLPEANHRALLAELLSNA